MTDLEIRFSRDMCRALMHGLNDVMTDLVLHRKRGNAAHDIVSDLRKIAHSHRKKRNASHLSFRTYDQQSITFTFGVRPLGEWGRIRNKRSAMFLRYVILASNSDRQRWLSFAVKTRSAIEARLAALDTWLGIDVIRRLGELDDQARLVTR